MRLITVNEGRDQRWDQILEIGRQNRGNYRQWVAQAGTLVADLLTVAGTDHVITMDLHVFRTDDETNSRMRNSKASSTFLLTIYSDDHC